MLHHVGWEVQVSKSMMLQMWLVKCRPRLVHCRKQAYEASYSESSVVNSPSGLLDSESEGIVIPSKCC